MEEYGIDDTRGYADPKEIRALEPDEDSKYRKYMRNTYGEVVNLLGTFLEDTYYPERTDEDTIRRFMEEMGEEAVRETIEEGRAVLALDPFPWEWVSGLTNKLVYDPEKNKWVEDAELYKQWVTWMVEALEEELKQKKSS
jgi:hypothetical protein